MTEEKVNNKEKEPNKGNITPNDYSSVAESISPQDKTEKGLIPRIGNALASNTVATYDSNKRLYGVSVVKETILNSTYKILNLDPPQEEEGEDEKTVLLNEVGRLNNKVKEALLEAKENKDKERIRLLKKVKDNISILDRVTRGIKPFNLTAKERELTTLLSYCLTQNDHREDVKEYIAAIAQGETPSKAVKLNIPLHEMSKLLGDKKEDVFKRLQSIAEKEQIQIYGIPKKDEDGIIEYEILKVYKPIIAIGTTDEKGDPVLRVEIVEGKNKGKEAIPVTFSTIFFSKLNEEYCPVLPGAFNLRNNEGKRITTDLVQTLLQKLQAERYRYLYKVLPHEKKQVEEKYHRNKSANKEEYNKEMKEAIRKGLTFPLLISTIKGLTNTDYETNNKMRATFWRDLNNALEALINYGIITNDSYIDRKNSNKVYFVYSLSFAQKDTLLPPTEEEI